MTNASEISISTILGATRRERLTKVLLGSAVATVAIVWMGWLLVQVALWLLVVTAIGLAVYFGYRASHIQQTQHSAGWWLRCGGCLGVGALVWWLIPRSDARCNATCAYWAELSRLCHQADAFSRNVVPSTTLAEAVTEIDTRLAFFHDMVDDISHLPTTLVDPEAVDLAVDYVQVLQEGNSIFDEMRTLIKQANSLDGQVRSPSLYLQSFMRGAMGDPWGVYNDVKAKSQQVSGQFAKVQARSVTLQEKIDALNSREMKLRVTLSNRYHREFPPLSSPHPRRSDPPKRPNR